ncbi:MAG: RICIN domain-containing protein [Pyrinomonadaceae bacterium]
MKRTSPFRIAARHAVESHPMKEARSAPASAPRALLTLLRLTSCLFCLTLCYSTAAAQADTYFEIVARHSGKCLDVEAESQAAGARVLQWDCGGWTNQQWRVIPVGGGYYKIVARHSGKVLDVQGGALTNGTPVWQYDENGSAAQQWQIIDVGGGYSRLIARHSGKALDVAGGSTATGAQIHQWDYVGGLNQQWLLRPLTYYEVVAKHSGKCLNVDGASTANGALLLQWDCLGVSNQQFHVVPVGGYYKIVARHSGKVLDVQLGGVSNGTPVWQHDENGTAAQQWEIIDVGGGYSRIMARHSGKALDVSGGSTVNGAQIHQWDYVGGGNQQWRLYPVSPAAEGRAQQGEWSPSKLWPFVAIHTTLLPNSKVLAWSRDKDGSGNDVAFSTQARVWDPATDIFTTVANGRTNMFCSGHTALPDGRLLVTGGHNYLDGVGLPHTNIFKYNTNQWVAGPDMNAGRWYPTNTTLANGEVLVVTGDTGSGHNTTPQVWQTNVANPALESWRSLPARDFALYPWMHVSPKDGRVFNSGPDGGNTGYLNTTTGAWTAGPPMSGGYYRGEGTSVMYDTGKIINLGGGSPPTNSAEIINLNATTPAWQTIAPMANARRHVNGTVLPDGTVLVTGGTSLGGNNEAGAVYAAELWNPAGAWPQWTTLASMRIPRLYHSTALLLPDGRVLSTGGGFGAGGTPYYEVEIFSPPYLFKGARPMLTNAPASVGYGQTFTVSTPHASSITKVTMVRLSSVTHSFNEDQRLATLPIVSVVSGGVNVTAPASGRHAPPGYYMLFILKGNGVPSEGRMIRIG